MVKALLLLVGWIVLFNSKCSINGSEVGLTNCMTFWSLEFNSFVSREVPKMIYSDYKAAESAGCYIIIIYKTRRFNREKS
jgi:hypothetical protein